MGTRGQGDKGTRERGKSVATDSLSIVRSSIYSPPAPKAPEASQASQAPESSLSQTRCIAASGLPELKQ